jgi:hypothetical protein
LSARHPNGKVYVVCGSSDAEALISFVADYAGEVCVKVWSNFSHQEWLAFSCAEDDVDEDK